MIFPPITAGIVAVCLAVVLRWRTREQLSMWRNNPLWWPWLAMYGLLVAGLFYTQNTHEASRDIVLKISMILLPVSFGALPRISEKHRNIALWTFVGSVTLAGAIALGRALWWQLVHQDDRFFAYNNFTISKFVSMHYFALYVGFAGLVVMSYWFKNLEKLRFWRHVGLLSWGGFLVTLLVILSVRMQFLAAPIAILAAILVLIRQTGRLRTGLLILSTGAVLFAGMVMSTEGSRTRLRDLTDELLSFKEITNEKQTNPRKYIWAEAKTIIAKNWLWGTGTGASDDLLQLRLQSCDALFWDGTGHYTLQSHRYNYHNEFMQHFATHGLGGLLFMLLIFIWPFTIKRLRNDYLTVGFLTLCFLSFLTESMLERQAGVLFFTFFYGLLVINNHAAAATK
jgi:O-antigen ligase